MAEAEDRQWEDRFRELLSSLVSRRLDPLASELSSLQSTFDAVCARLVEQARSSNDEAIEAITGEMRQQLAKSGDASRVREGTLQFDFEVARRSDRALLNSSIAEIDRQRTQAGVLTATLEATSAFSQRVALFVVRSGNLVGWRGLGFGNESANIALLASPIADRTLLSDAINERRSVPLERDFDATYLSFLGPFAELGRASAIAVPLVVRDKAAAVLFADAEGPDGFDVQPLETLMRVASMAIELLPLRRSTEPPNAELPNPRILTSSLHGVGAPATRALKNETHHPEAVVDVHGPHESEPEGHRPESHPDEPSPSVAEHAVVTVTNHKQTSSGIGEVIQTTATDPREHLNARRFARFLVGEIRLYQPSRVAEGCRRADLYDRLRDEIERSQKLYERHVRSQITVEFDYFYHELVTTLAEGNATKLGRNFPAPQS